MTRSSLSILSRSARVARSDAASAVALFEKSLKTHQARLGPDNPGTLTIMDNLGTGYLVAGFADGSPDWGVGVALRMSR